MPTYPLINAAGARVRLTRPQWDCLCELVALLEKRPLLDTWLVSDLYPARDNQHNAKRRLVTALVDKGVLERRPAGLHLPARVRAQVRSSPHGQPEPR